MLSDGGKFPLYPIPAGRKSAPCETNLCISLGFLPWHACCQTLGGSYPQIKSLWQCPRDHHRIVKETNIKNGRISQAAANLFPGYFALVMATGIISIATFLLEMKPLAWALLVV